MKKRDWSVGLDVLCLLAGPRRTQLGVLEMKSSLYLLITSSKTTGPMWLDFLHLATPHTENLSASQHLTKCGFWMNSTVDAAKSTWDEKQTLFS